jgi:hypothetical protein
MEFSDIALAKLLQTVPELGSLIINFQDVSDELPEEATTQVGIFILRSGGDIFYVPVISKNDNVYPIDSIFFDSKQKFFPLTKKTVSLILNSSQLETGKPYKIPNTVVGNPSVYELINPPRTGKYVYASSSRLTDFISMLPDHVKKATIEHITQEKSVYDDLDKLFSIKAIFDALKPAPKGMAAKTNESPISIVTDANPDITAEGVSNILNDGYHVSGVQPSTRVALSFQEFNTDGKFREVTGLDGDTDFVFVMENGTTRDAFVPKMHKLCSTGGRSLAIFTNGDFAMKSSFVAVGDTLNRKAVLDSLFNYNPPVLLSECNYGDTIVLSLADGTFMGPFNVRQCARTEYGVDMKISDYSGSRFERIQGFRNFNKMAEVGSATIFVPSNVIVIKLYNNITSETEDHLNCAVKKREIAAMQHLGTELNLGFDGIEYAINGRPIGDEPKIMEVLVVKEQLDPNVAKKFVKEAALTKHVKIYMSKQASTDYTPAEIPQYGIMPDSNAEVAPNGAFMPAVQQSLQLGDSQVAESTIISELLQVPDMFEYIGEYLPDIEETIDKLGRILFVSRINLNQLAEGGDAESVFSFLATLKGVYRLMGDNFLKLEQITSLNRNTTSQNVEEE